jgi:hypothetical protein
MNKLISISGFLSIFYLSLCSTARACSVCFGPTPDKAMSDALKYGILSLLLVLVGILALFAHFFASFQRRAKNMS